MPASSDVEKSGYSILKSFFEEAELARIRDEFMLFFSTITGSSPESWESMNEQLIEISLEKPEQRSLLYNAAQLAPSLMETACLPKVKELLTSLGYKAPILRNMNIRLDVPQLGSCFLVDWHQDFLNLAAGISYTMWIPLQDIDEDTGGVRVLDIENFEHKEYPGEVNEEGYSRVAIDQIPNSHERLATMSYGDLLLFCPYLPHASQQGTTKPRWTFIVRYDCLSTFYDITKKEPNFERRSTSDPYLRSRGAEGLYTEES